MLAKRILPRTAASQTKTLRNNGHAVSLYGVSIVLICILFKHGYRLLGCERGGLA
jgi:hypothetical protein